jgi:hypothetical protein
MRRILSCAIAIIIGHAIALADSDVLSPLRFLVGEWHAIDTPAGETGAFTFTLAVQDHVMVRTNEAVYEATADRPGSRHDDLMVIYAERGSLKADYFDNEGHVIRYVVQAHGGDSAVFVGESRVAGEPGYRLTYTASVNGTLLGSFEIASPSTPETFKPYLSWKAQKR